MEPKKNYTNINSNSFQSLITQICARSKSLLILWNFLKIGVANFLEDATHRLSNILPMAFRTYRSWPLAHTPARNICGRSKLWCWRHRCTVRGSTLGAVYTSCVSGPCTDVCRCTYEIRKFSRKFVEKIRFRTSFGRRGTSGKSRATRCQNSSLLRRLATTKTSKKRFGKKSIFWGFGNQFFVIFHGFWRELTILGVKINFLVKFCSKIHLFWGPCDQKLRKNDLC